MSIENIEEFAEELVTALSEYEVHWDMTHVLNNVDTTDDAGRPVIDVTSEVLKALLFEEIAEETQDIVSKLTQLLCLSGTVKDEHGNTRPRQNTANRAVLERMGVTFAGLHTIVLMDEFGEEFCLKYA